METILEACSQSAASVTLMVVINRKLFVYCIRYLPNYRITTDKWICTIEMGLYKLEMVNKLEPGAIKGEAIGVI